MKYFTTLPPAASLSTPATGSVSANCRLLSD